MDDAEYRENRILPQGPTVAGILERLSLPVLQRVAAIEIENFRGKIECRDGYINIMKMMLVKGYVTLNWRWRATVKNTVTIYGYEAQDGQ